MTSIKSVDVTVCTIKLPSSREVEQMTTDKLCKAFLLSDLFQPARLSLVFTDMDRLVVGGPVPDGDLTLSAVRQTGTRCFSNGRETGIVNIGDPGDVLVGGVAHTLERFSCLYVRKGEGKSVSEEVAKDSPCSFCAAHPITRNTRLRCTPETIAMRYISAMKRTRRGAGSVNRSTPEGWQAANW